eukprot:TRINITY_DN40457_c0_g1_i1.p1 TRINITY_DN40457_c0_g1~~TRINITY_DN40457_c0_g1_i1.p1  ORF type:complete len:478 (-),score=63.57 TRINITY_DN40457_c0_g1_i1:399-1832(-)
MYKAANIAINDFAICRHRVAVTSRICRRNIVFGVNPTKPSKSISNASCWSGRSGGHHRYMSVAKTWGDNVVEMTDASTCHSHHAERQTASETYSCESTNDTIGFESMPNSERSPPEHSTHFVPTIDLSLLRGGAAERKAFAEELRACCHEGVGFFYLVGHGVEQSLIDAIEELVRAAFALPEDEKSKLDKRKSPHFRGWEQVGSERTQGRIDYREQFDTWSECAAVPEELFTDSSTPQYMRLIGRNQFFDDTILPGYKALTLEWHAELSAVAVELLEGFSLALGLPAGTLNERFGEVSMRQSLIKYIRYPPTPEGESGVGVHQDSLFITLLLPGAVSGLEVQLPCGNFLAVERRQGAFVVNLGEALQLITGNYMIATPHRVRSRAERHSVGFFYGPTLDTDLRPLELAPRYSTAVSASPRHRGAGTMPTKAELDEGVDSSFAGESRHRTFGDMLWTYFSRAYPDNMVLHYPKAHVDV